MSLCIMIKDPYRLASNGLFTDLEMSLWKDAKINNYAPLYQYYSNDKYKNSVVTKSLKPILNINPGDYIYLRVNNLIMAKGKAIVVPTQDSDSVINENLASVVNNSTNLNGRNRFRADSCLTTLQSSGTNNRRGNWVMLFDDAPCFLHSRAFDNHWGQHIYVEKWEELERPVLVKANMFISPNNNSAIKELKEAATASFK
ncbi:MAG: hypothetical protein JJE21_00920 [Spirochaetaceae bacterium]|nr:hypothetical protein [Spirochaetaceae bacterium]